MIELEKILESQSSILLELNTSIQLIKEYRNRIISNDHNYLKHNNSINLLLRIVLNNVFLHFHKIIRDDNFSINVVMKHLKMNFNDPKLLEIKTTKKNIDKLFTKNELNEIRNEYVAHIDSERKTRTYNWKELYQLNDNLILFYNQVKNLIGQNKTIFIDEDLLVNILDSYKKLNDIYEARNEYFITKDQKVLEKLLFI
ncbi:MAG: hypothetical protein ACEQSR_10850 [Candidatus Methylacidiphilales bacterium]